jgi:hypothetical protein
MRSTTQSQQFQAIIELGERAWVEERFLLEDPAHLQALADLFPHGRTRPWASHPVDLDRLNDLSRPLGYLASWEPEGLVFFRIHL